MHGTDSHSPAGHDGPVGHGQLPALMRLAYVIPIVVLAAPVLLYAVTSPSDARLSDETTAAEGHWPSHPPPQMYRGTAVIPDPRYQDPEFVEGQMVALNVILLDVLKRIARLEAEALGQTANGRLKEMRDEVARACPSSLLGHPDATPFVEGSVAYFDQLVARIDALRGV